jgi:hypothetical protein
MQDVDGKTDGLTFAADAQKFMADKRCDTGQVRQFDGTRDALKKIQQELRQYMSGTCKLDVPAMMSMCSAGLA